MTLHLNIYSVFLGTFLIAIILSISTPVTRSTMLRIHSDANDRLSWMRVASSMLIIAAILLLLCEKIMGEPISESLILSFIGTAFGGKFLQSGINKEK